MKTARLTTAQAIVRYLVAQRTMIDGREEPLFPGVFAIFGHGNVTSLGHALEQARAELPTYRGQNEQTMALAAAAFAKAMRRRQVMVATSSIGPGALNMVTAAGVAHANRLPLLLLSGDTFASRVPDPVLQQIEPFDTPSTSVNDAFRPVTRFWDRIVRPEQVVSALPLAVETMLDPADCGPAFIGLPQDIQAEAYDFPERLFERRVHELRRPRPDRRQLDEAVAALRTARRPLIVAGGGVHYSFAEEELGRFAEAHAIPVVETMAGKSSLVADHPCWAGPIGVTGWDHANRLATDADVVLAVGTRLQDFTTGSWTVFGNATLVALNVARFDATKHLAHPLVADALEGLTELERALADHPATPWADPPPQRRPADVSGDGASPVPSYADVIHAVNQLASADDYVVAAAGGLPGELNVNWFPKGVGTFDCEYGFSCMGYEIAGGWGARMARREGEVICFAGDGSYLMHNSELLSSVLSGHKLIVVLCDNGGYAVIERLQLAQGGASFNNMFPDGVQIDWVAHARALGCEAEPAATIGELEDAFTRARETQKTTVIAVKTAPQAWTEGGAFWEVGVPEVSTRREVVEARERLLEGKRAQRVGW
jgi:3D-(3,5/4)-trihydroxycyclohexane-1,2-dione acylhydrolase (decyclizing)